MDQDRTLALEERVAHLTRAVEEMSDEVARQAAEIARLAQGLRLVAERAPAPDEGGVVLGDERPPHW